MPKFSLSIRASLGYLFGTMLVISVLQGAIAYSKIINISSETTALIDNTAPSMVEANEINALVLRTRLWQFRYMTAENETAKAQSQEKVREFSGNRDA